MDEGIVQIIEGSERKEVRVLILVVVEDGLVQNYYYEKEWIQIWVLILVVVEDGLVHDLFGEIMVGDDVLILVVVDDGLVLILSHRTNFKNLSSSLL